MGSNNNMIFATPTLYIFLIILIAIACSSLFYVTWKSTNFFNAKSFWNFLRTRNFVLTKPSTKLIILFAAFIMITVSLFRPVWGERVLTIETEGADVLFMLDVSKSMNALDMSVENQLLDRLTASKLLIADMVSDHPENRYGLILFAGEAFVSSPLTSDSSAFLTFLNTADTNDVSIQGTDLLGALSLAIGRFDNIKEKDEGKRGKVILLISDGGEDTPEDIAVLAEEIKKQSVRVYTLGVGGEKGAPIPVAQDFFGNIAYKQHDGQTVYTKLNESPLKKISSLTEGSYVHLESGKDIQAVAKKLQDLDTTPLKYNESAGGEEQYQKFLFLGAILFLLYIFAERLYFIQIITKKIVKFPSK